MRAVVGGRGKGGKRDFRIPADQFETGGKRCGALTSELAGEIALFKALFAIIVLSSVEC